MAVTTFAKPRPKCRICGARSHVITVANAKSPMLNCCASCGVAARQLAEWFKYHSEAELNRLMNAVQNSCSETVQIPRRNAANL